MTSPLNAVAHWPCTAAAGIARLGVPGDEQAFGPVHQPFAWASVTKILTSMCIWIGVEEGTVDLEERVDPPAPAGATLGDLLSHASGLAPDTDQVLSPPRHRRVYSNRGIELAAEHLARRSGISFSEYMEAGVLAPLDMTGTTLEGSPASGATGPLVDLMAIARELLEPTLFSRATLQAATSVACAGLPGVLPGFGRQERNDWGLGVEIRDSKQPHWTGRRNSPATFGHFGQSGSFLWVDPTIGLALGSLSDRPFGPWATEAWPALSDAVIDHHG